MNEKHDDKVIRCPRVGGDVTFRFCRTENNLLPCKWIVNCWKNHFDIEKYINEHYSAEEKQRVFTPTSPKMHSLLKLIEKSKK